MPSPKILSCTISKNLTREKIKFSNLTPINRLFYYICTVKFLAVILSVYFLGINFIPCDDTAPIESQDTIAVILEFDQDQHGEQNGTADDCPPFCQCHCCHVHVVQLNTNTFEVFEPKNLFLTPLFGESAGKDIAKFHFQPPRV